MKTLYTWMCLLGLISIPFLGNAQHGAQESNDPFAALKGEIFSLVNKQRKAKNLTPLVYNNYLDELASEHSRDMAKGKVEFGHEGFEKRAEKAKKEFKSIKGFAENVAQGKMDAQQVMKVWLGSKGHKKNIEGKYEMIGIGVAEDKNGVYYFTQIFVLQ